jgi:IS30 family transposase
MPDLPSIHLRPPEADERLVPGHWEGDFLKGAANRSAVGTLVDRMSLFVMVVKMDACNALAALDGFSRAFAPLDVSLCQTLTYDPAEVFCEHCANQGITLDPSVALGP